MSGRIGLHTCVDRAAESFKKTVLAVHLQTNGFESEGHDFKSQFNFGGREPQQNCDFQCF